MGVAVRAGSRGPTQWGCDRPRVLQSATGASGMDRGTTVRAGSRGPTQRGCNRLRVLPQCAMKGACHGH
jgi:hypothetical protein